MRSIWAFWNENFFNRSVSFDEDDVWAPKGEQERALFEHWRLFLKLFRCWKFIRKGNETHCRLYLGKVASMVLEMCTVDG